MVYKTNVRLLFFNSILYILKMRRNKPMLLPIVLKIVILRLFLHITSFIPIKRCFLV